MFSKLTKGLVFLILFLPFSVYADATNDSYARAAYDLLNTVGLMMVGCFHPESEYIYNSYTGGDSRFSFRDVKTGNIYYMLSHDERRTFLGKKQVRVIIDTDSSPYIRNPACYLGLWSPDNDPVP